MDNSGPTSDLCRIHVSPSMPLAWASLINNNSNYYNYSKQNNGDLPDHQADGQLASVLSGFVHMQYSVYHESIVMYQINIK